MINVKDFGAAGDGICKDTAAIQRAVDAGGMVCFPPGIYLTGTIYLKSCGGLYLEPGAVLKASPDKEDYNAPDFCEQNRFSTAEHAFGAHLIAAVEQENITICGGGRIDGNRQAFYGTDEEVRSDLFIGEHFSREELKKTWRPGQMIFFCECKNVSVHDVQLFHAPYWTLFCHGCEDVLIRSLRILNDQRTINGDGIDIDCCCRVTISDCIIDSGDDCITLRGNCAPLKNKRSCEFITVTNCILHTNCNGIRIGVGCGKIRNAVFSNIVFHHCRTGIVLCSNYSTDPAQGVEIENISFENLQLNALRPFSVVTQVRGSTPEPAAQEIRNISFRHIRGTFCRTSWVSGCAGTGIKNISFEDVELTCLGSDLKQSCDFTIPFGEWGELQPEAMFFISHAENIRFDRFRVLSSQENAEQWKYGMISYNSKDVSVLNSNFIKELLSGDIKTP